MLEQRLFPIDGEIGGGGEKEEREEDECVLNLVPGVFSHLFLYLTQDRVGGGERRKDLV